jgi:hypothetical protein
MEQLIPILDMLYAPQAWFLAQEKYVSMAIVGLMIAATLTLTGFLLARMGYKPLWALLLLVPTVNVVAIWTLAFLKFPREKTE